MTSYAYDGENGALTPRQIVPTLPSSFTGDNTGSEIAVAPSGRFLYASNRGHDSIAGFAIDADGLLSPLAWEPTQGSTPRFFTLDPDGTRLYSLNEQGDTIVEFRVDAESGRLSPTGQVISSKSPACLVFV